jgi:SAM-dependent methyltransferase
VATAYASTFAALCAGTYNALLTGAGLPGDRPLRVLDVGAGTGELAALAVCTGAGVTAVDPGADMIAVAARTAPAARLCRAALPALPFGDGAFDAVLANFVVNHLPDPRAGLREIARVTAPGGRVAVTIWPSGQTVQSRLWADAIAASGAVVPASTRLPVALDFPRTTDGLAGLLTDAGLHDVRAGLVSWEHDTSPELLWEGAAAGVAGIGQTVVHQTPEVRERMRTELHRLAGPLLRDGRLVLPSQAVLATATR